MYFWSTYQVVTYRLLPRTEILKKAQLKRITFSKPRMKKVKFLNKKSCWFVIKLSSHLQTSKPCSFLLCQKLFCHENNIFSQLWYKNTDISTTRNPIISQNTNANCLSSNTKPRIVHESSAILETSKVENSVFWSFDHFISKLRKLPLPNP